MPIGSPIPRAVGGSSPIKHVFYIIRENRTYDQILGDLVEGNGDPKLAIFGRDRHPERARARAELHVVRQFLCRRGRQLRWPRVLDGGLCDRRRPEAVADLYANRGGLYLGEGGGFMRNPSATSRRRTGIHLGFRQPRPRHGA